MTKMKQVKWQDRPRIEKLAAAMYFHLAPPEVQREMLAANPEQAAALQSRMDQGDRLYGKASPPPVDYSKVPGLIPVKRRSYGKGSKWWRYLVKQDGAVKVRP